MVRLVDFYNRSHHHSHPSSVAEPVTLCSGLAPEIPEDLYHLIKKAVSVRKHLERNRKDKDSKVSLIRIPRLTVLIIGSSPVIIRQFRLILIESRIHRLTRYYKTKSQLSPSFKYESATASTLVS